MASENSSRSTPAVGRLAARVAFGLALTLAIALAIFFRGQIDVAAVEDWVRAAGFWAPAVYMLAYVLATLLFVPGALFTLAAGALFGPLWGSVYALVAGTVGATLAFLIARYFAANWVARRGGGLLRRLIEGVEEEGWRFVAFVRLVPLFPFNLLNYALGLARIPLRDYVAASLVCMAPATLSYAYLGYAGRQALAGQKSAIENGLLALALLAVAVFVPPIALKLRRRKKT